MLKTSLFAVLTAIAAASDDQSLMQQAVGVASQVTSAELRTALGQIENEISEIPHKGKANQMAFDALMSSVKSSEKLDDDAINVIGQIITLLDTILAQMRSTNTEDQGELNEIQGAIQSCNSDSAAAGDGEDSFDALESSHSDCREAQSVADDDHVTKCTAMSNWLENMKGQFSNMCVHNSLPTEDLDPGQIQTWRDWFHQGYAFFNERSSTVEAQTTPCKNAEDALAAQVSSCQNAQNQFELKFCTWRSQRITRCGNLDTCYADEVSLHATLVGRVTPDANSRMAEAAVVYHVKCLLENLVQGITDISLCSGLPAPAQADYNVTLPTWDDKAACDLSGTTPFPGSGDATGAGSAWHNEQYADFGSGGKSAAVDTGITC